MSLKSITIIITKLDLLLIVVSYIVSSIGKLVTTRDKKILNGLNGDLLNFFMFTV